MQNMKQMMVPLLVLAALVVTAISFAWQGTAMHAQVTAEEAKFHALQSSYFHRLPPVYDANTFGEANQGRKVEVEVITHNHIKIWIQNLVHAQCAIMNTRKRMAHADVDAVQ